MAGVTLYKLPNLWSTATGTAVSGLQIEEAVLRGGKDSVQSLVPAKPPECVVRGFADTAPALAAGDAIALNVDEGNARIFYGVLDTPKVTRMPGGYQQVELTARGRSVLLFRNTGGSTSSFPNELFPNRTVANAITNLLAPTGENWPSGLLEVSTGFAAISLPYWWKPVGKSAADALRELMLVAGLPAYIYESPHDGVLHILDTQWARADTREAISLEPEDIHSPVIQTNREINTVNRATATREMWALEATATTVWELAGTLPLVAGLNRIRVQLREPAFSLNLAPADFTVTGTTLMGNPFLLVNNGVSSDIGLRTAGAGTLTAGKMTGRRLLSQGEMRHFHQDATSVAERGPVDWTGRPWPGITPGRADAIVLSIVRAYVDGIITHRVQTPGGARWNTITPGYPVTITVAPGVVQSTRVQSWTREFRHRQDTMYLVLERDAGLLAGGSGPFTLGTSTLDGDDLLWG